MRRAAQDGLGAQAKKCLAFYVRNLADVGPTTAEDVRDMGFKHECACGETWDTLQGLRQHQRSCDRAHDAFVPSQEGDGVHDVEQLLEVAGPPDNRYWRPKWAGLDDNGKDLYPDLGKGDGNVSEFGWQPERNLIGSEHV